MGSLALEQFITSFLFPALTIYYNKLRIYRVIQEKSAILWEMIVCVTKQKSSYEHGSNFERLPRYGKKKILTILQS
jgi:hypothetical protein